MKVELFLFWSSFLLYQAVTDETKVFFPDNCEGFIDSITLECKTNFTLPSEEENAIPSGYPLAGYTWDTNFKESLRPTTDYTQIKEIVNETCKKCFSVYNGEEWKAVPSCPNDDLEYDFKSRYCFCNNKEHFFNGEGCIPNESAGEEEEDILNHFYQTQKLIYNNNPNNEVKQSLANLLTLKGRYPTNQTTFSEFSDENEDPLPKITYSKKSNLNDKKFIPDIMSFNKNDKTATSIFQLYIAKWDINGLFHGITKLSNELNLCTSTYNDNIDYLLLGSSVVNECIINYEKYKSREYKMMFYDLYLKLNNGSYIPVPIKIKGLVGNENENDNENQAIYRRRFFIMDNLSGIPNTNSRVNVSNDGYYRQEEPTSLRYAKTISFRVKLQNENKKSLIYLPYFEITLERVTFVDPEDPSKPINPKQFSFTLKSEYYMNFNNVKNGINIAFWIMFVLCILVIIVSMLVWAKTHPVTLSNQDCYCCYVALTLLINSFKYFGLFMFAFTSGVSAYWYCFFKLQKRPYVFFPLTKDAKSIEKDFYIVWGLGMGSYIIYMCYRLYRQTNYDVFFVDWEHDKDVLIHNQNNCKTFQYKSAWRSLHIANMFNQLQHQRTISIPFCFCWLIMLWYYDETKWKEYAMNVPNISFVEKCPEHFLLRHFIMTFIIFVAGLTQYYVLRLVQLWLPLKKTEFLDLCSVSNISVFILDSSLHGYYIHGQSPLGVADTNFDDLVKFLEEEGKGKIRGRGITDDQDDELQSYEVYISFGIRNFYRAIYADEAKFLIQQTLDPNNQSRMSNPYKHIPNLRSRASIDFPKTCMNSFLKEKIEKAARYSKIFIREKTLCERFFDLPPGDFNFENKENLDVFFYKDPGKNFDNVLFTGMEIEWLIMVIYWLQMWTIALEKFKNSMPLAIFLTYVIEKILFKCRMIFGERNVARKSIIDDRFFS